MSGAALFDGGAGDDALWGGDEAEIYLGGQGNDSLTTRGGNDLSLFNKGDGNDMLYSPGGGHKTLSLGGNFSYGDLFLNKSGRNLVFSIGDADQITFVDWYAAAPVRLAVNLQVITATMGGFKAGGRDPLSDQNVETFDFSGLIGAFDAARATKPGLHAWSLMGALSNFHLSGSDREAIGGELAYEYGRNSTLAGIGLAAKQAVIADSMFAARAQAFHPDDTAWWRDKTEL